MNIIRARLAAVRRGLPLVFAVVAAAAAAHGANVGDIAIGHPYATPSLAGTSNGAAYLASIENKGSVADRLVRASTPAAARVEIHTMAVDAQGVMRMREIDGIALAPKAKVQMKPGTGLHLMLIDLKEPLKQDATFPMTLEFERAGKVEVKVIVSQPKPAGAATESHQH
ncbi:MAG: copper chaperone PCu(A)C [Caldimonas sp.]